MDQLNLKIISSLPYSAANFVMHEGVRDALRDVFALVVGRKPAIVWAYGPARFGKTHFAVKLCEELISYAFFPHLIDGSQFAEFLAQRGARGPFSEDEIFVIDGVEEYFETHACDSSGPLVAFFELARSARVPVVLLSSLARSCLNCDEHIMSRLRAGHLAALLRPSDGDMPQLINSMARQRGILLTRKRVGFIAKRLSRDIPSIEEYLNKVSRLSLAQNRPVKRTLLSEAL